MIGGLGVAADEWYYGKPGFTYVMTCFGINLSANFFALSNSTLNLTKACIQLFGRRISIYQIKKGEVHLIPVLKVCVKVEISFFSFCQDIDKH